MGLLAAFPLLLIGIVFVLFETGLQKLRTVLLRGCQHFLKKPPYMKDDEFSEARYIIACLAYLLFPAGVLFGESTNLQSILSQINETGTGAYAGIVDLASLLLYLFVPAFLFMVWLELHDMPIFGVRLFPNIAEKLKKWLGISTLVVIILATLAFLCLWVYRAQALAHPEALNTLPNMPPKPVIFLPLGLSLTLADIRLVLFALMGIVTPYATLFAVLGLKVGLIGLGVLITGGLSALASGLEFFPCHMIAHLLSYPCLFLTRGELTPYTSTEDLKKIIERRQQQHQHQQAEEEMFHPHPSHFPQGKKKAGKNEKIGSFVFVGHFGSLMYEPMTEAVRLLRAATVLFASGGFSLSAPTEQFVLPDTQSVSPGEEARQQVHDKRGHKQEKAAADRQAYSLLLNCTGEHLVQEYQQKELTNEAPPLLFAVDCRHLADADGMLRTIKSALPFSAIALLTAISPEDMQDPIVREGRDTAQTWWQEGIVETILTVDLLHAPFGLDQGRQTLCRCVAHALVSGCLAQTQYRSNLSFVEVLTQLGKRSAFSSLTLAASEVDPGTLPTRYKWRELLPGKNRRGTGDLVATINKTKELISQVIDSTHPTHQATLTLAVPMKQQQSGFVVCDLPFTKPDTERFKTVKDELDKYVETTFPFASLLLTRGNGVPSVSQQSQLGYWVQVSYFSAIALPERAGSKAQPQGLLEAGHTMRQEAAADGEAAEQPFVPFIVDSPQSASNGTGSGNGHVDQGTRTAKPAKRTQSTTAKRGEARGPRDKAGAGKKDTAQDSSTKRSPGRPRKQPVERR